MGHDSFVGPLLAAHPSYAASFVQILTDPLSSQPEDIARAVLWLASD